jgi:hypothetical protein
VDNHLAVRTLGPNAMVAFNTRYLADLAGPGRLGFIATNGLHDCAVIDGEQEDEYRRRLREGWHVVAVRPICRSHVPKLVHTHPDLVNARAFSYSLVILENPLHQKIAAHSAALRAGNVPAAPRRG